MFLSNAVLFLMCGIECVSLGGQDGVHSTERKNNEYIKLLLKLNSWSVSVMVRKVQMQWLGLCGKHITKPPNLSVASVFSASHSEQRLAI